MTNSEMKAAYLDYVNNFMTLDAFATHYEITREFAEYVIFNGRILHAQSLTS